MGAVLIGGARFEKLDLIAAFQQIIGRLAPGEAAADDDDSFHHLLIIAAFLGFAIRPFKVVAIRIIGAA